MPIILPNGDFLFDDDNAAELLLPDVARGLRPRREHPRYAGYGSIPGTVPFNSSMPPRIPRDEWPERIADLDALHGWLTNLIDWPARNQAKTNFCWANGPCTAAEIEAAVQGLAHVEWSAASVACPIKNYRNQGGWGADAVEYLVETGACATAYWPNAAIARQYDDQESRADRANRRVLEWVDVPADDFDALATCLLSGYACAVGYDWWGHEVCATRLVQTGKRSYGVEIRNSWGDDWGSKNEHGVGGFSVLSESKGTPDDCQAVRQVVVPEA
jgi:hypothetical protein